MHETSILHSHKEANLKMRLNFQQISNSVFRCYASSSTTKKSASGKYDISVFVTKSFNNSLFKYKLFQVL